MSEYKVKDLKLAMQGKKNVFLAEKEMKALMQIKKDFSKKKPFKGLTIGIALHITKETANLVRTLKAGGAKIAITGCNPLSTQDDVAAFLARKGFMVFGYKGESNKEYYEFLHKVLDKKPNITIDDGCDLVTLIHKERTELIDNIVGGTEETTTGVIRLKAMQKSNALKYPVIAVNDNLTKHLFDNYYGTGQSTLDGILRATNTMFAGKTMVVAGYGSCGKGVALRAKGMGCNVIVTEVDPLPALQAKMDGFTVMPMSQAVKYGDIYVTVTGNKHVIRPEHIKKMKDGAILSNSGHFDIEINVSGLKNMAKKRRVVRQNMEEYVLPNGKRVYLLAEGRLVNLAAAEGHPSIVMSLSFCGQSLAAEYLTKHSLQPGVHFLPPSIDKKIARLQLSAMNVKIDRLTKEQKKYLASWEEGT